MSLAHWYISFIVHVFPITVQEIVQRLLLIHVKDSAVTVPIGTPLVLTRERHVFLDAPYTDSSLQIQPSFSLATINLVFLGSSHVSQKNAAHFLWQVTRFQIFTSCLSHFLCLFSCRSLLYITCFQNSFQTVLRPREKFIIHHHKFLALNGKPCAHTNSTSRQRTAVYYWGLQMAHHFYQQSE